VIGSQHNKAGLVGPAFPFETGSTDLVSMADPACRFLNFPRTLPSHPERRIFSRC
jgi:hypothetical protein